MFPCIVIAFPVLFPVFFRNTVDLVRGPAQGNFTQGGKIIHGKKMIHGRARLLRAIYLSLLQPFQKLRRLDIHKLHLIRLVKNKIRYPFLYRNPRDGCHNVVQAFQVLHIYRGIYTDPFLEQLLDILVPLGMAASRRIRVGQLIHQDQTGPPFQRRIQVKFLQHYVFIRDFQRRKLLQPLQKGHGFRARMRFYIPGSDIDPRFRRLMGRFQHRIGLAHSCGIPKKYF